MTTFIDRCRLKLSTPSDVDSWIESWHMDKECYVPLNESLGMTVEEYNLWTTGKIEIESLIEDSNNGNRDTNEYTILDLRNPYTSA